jgi:hypothetical protein
MNASRAPEGIFGLEKTGSLATGRVGRRGVLFIYMQRFNVPMVIEFYPEEFSSFLVFCFIPGGLS